MTLSATRRKSVLLAGLAISMLIVPVAVKAHPHVWVSVKTTVLYDRGTITGLQHHWTFDEFYTASAIAGLDVNNDGTYDRQELAPLAQVNIDGLKGFDYFTFATLAGGKLSFEPPMDYWLEHKDGVLTLHFTLPLKLPVLAEAEGFAFSVYDPSFYVALGFAKEDPISLAGNVPSGCNVRVGVPDGAGTAQRLADAFSKQLGGTVSGGESAVSITCPAQ